MTFEIPLFTLAHGAGVLTAIFTAVAAWRRRRVPGDLAFVLMTTSLSLWTGAAFLNDVLSGPNAETVIRWVSAAGRISAAPLFLLFAWHYRAGHPRIRLPAGLLLWVIPVTSLALTGGATTAWWILPAYQAVLALWAGGMIARTLAREQRMFAARGVTTLAAVIVTWAGSALAFYPLSGLDAPALSYSLAGFLILWGLTSGRMLALSPIARSMLVEAMPDGLIVEDAGGLLADANPVALSLLRKDPTVIGLPLAQALDDWPDLAAALARAGHASIQVVRREDFVFELTVAELAGPRDVPLGRMVSLRDITGRQRAEDATGESERNLRVLLAAAQRQAKELELVDRVRTSLAREMDLPVIFRTVVEGIAAAFGYTLVSLYVVQDDSLVMQHQVGYTRVLTRIPVTQGISGRVIRSGVPVLLEDVRTDPEYLEAIEDVVSEVCVPLMDQGRAVGALNVESTGGVAMGEADLRLMTALAEHVSIALAKARLYADARENEQRYRTLVATLGEGVAIVDLAEHFVFVNPAAESVFGMPPGGLVGRNLADFLGPAELAFSKSETRKRVRGMKSSYELTIRRPDGQARQIEMIATPHRGATGEVIGTLGIFRDVTELRRLQRSLEEERSTLLSLIDNVPDYVYLKDRGSRFILTNKATAALFGLSDPKEMIGRTDHDFVKRDLADRYREDDLRVMESGVGVVNVEEPSLPARGGTRKLLTTKVPIFDESGAVTGLVGISRDVTDFTRAEEERERLQEQLQQAQKMEAVGRLAGGIAHDFNNILTVITGYCELAVEESAGNTAIQKNMEEIKRAALRASGLISQLLAFSRRQVLQPRVFDLGALVQDMEGMLRRLLGEDIRLRTTRAESSLLVHADPGRMEQVIMNLAVNSRDAMPGGGLLTIHAGVGLLPDELAAPSGPGSPAPASAEQVMLLVSDTGQGMDPATLDRLYEPFFTTKEVGKGTGLGLATVYGIVRQSSGLITCRSEVGSGTTFTIYLPRASQEAADRDSVELHAASLQRGTEKVLLVEDDESVRRFVKTVLANAGYTVFAADSGMAAIEKLESLPSLPDLLLTDVIMPGMDGRVLAEEVTRRLPGIRLMFMSGYADLGGAHPVPRPADPRLVHKPFSAAELLRKVREILDQPVSPGT
jgi:PAS domain S-box-containing protein